MDAATIAAISAGLVSVVSAIFAGLVALRQVPKVRSDVTAIKDALNGKVDK